MDLKKYEYFKTEYGTLYNGDCLDLLPYIKPVDLTITSPPYNMQVKYNHIKKRYERRHERKEFSKKYEYFYDCVLPIKKYYSFHRKVLSLLINLSNTVFWNVQLVSGNKEAVFKIFGHFCKNIKEVIFWDKMISEPAMFPGVINKQGEIITVFEKEGRGRKLNYHKFNKGTLSDTWKIKADRQNKKIRACFPKELIVKILSNWKAQTVLDPFSGSGQTGAVCEYYKINWIAIEKAEKACEIAKRNIFLSSRKRKSTLTRRTI